VDPTIQISGAVACTGCGAHRQRLVRR
jgi:hypothetical protein